MKGWWIDVTMRIGWIEVDHVTGLIDPSTLSFEIASDSSEDTGRVGLYRRVHGRRRDHQVWTRRPMIWVDAV